MNPLRFGARGACRRLGCEIGDEVLLGDPEDPDDQLLGQLEHLIHELCHAVLLRIEVRGPKLGEAISDALRPRPCDEQVTEEARAWALAWNVWQELGEIPFSLGDCFDHAAIQGVDRALLNMVLEQDWDDEIALVVEHVTRECQLSLNESCLNGNMTVPP